MAPYEIWNTRRSLGVMRDVEPAYTFWQQFFPYSINSDSEWIDFEKLPKVARKLAPFVRPLGAGKPLYDDTATGFRFKPAYTKVREVVDVLMPLIKRPGIDSSMLDEPALTPMQRRALIKMAMTQNAVNAIERRWEWMRARAIIDGGYIVQGEEYPAVELDFRRDPGHTVIKTSGNFWGQTGVSIFDDIQLYCDTMFNAPFGGFPRAIVMGPKVWAVVRKDEEILKHMDINIRNERATVERALITSEKVVKVGELVVGGASGATIELWLYRDTFLNDNNVEVPFLEETDIVMVSSAERIQGYECFGAIIDPYANYQPLNIFPRNWMETGDPANEYLLFQSAPLMVPVNPNATLKATVVAA